MSLPESGIGPAKASVLPTPALSGSPLAGSPLSSPVALSAAARASIVNRTRRVVRERAMELQQRKKSRRELVLPLLICSAVLALVLYAAKVVVCGTCFGAVGSEIEQEAGKLFTAATMDTGSPVLLLLLWFLPVTVVTAVVVQLRRKRGSRDRGRDGAASPRDGRLREESTR